MDDDVLFLPAGGGRAYEVGAMRALFKADGGETGDRYCVSEWWLEGGESGPGAHHHEANACRGAGPVEAWGACRSPSRTSGRSR